MGFGKIRRVGVMIEEVQFKLFIDRICNCRRLNHSVTKKRKDIEYIPTIYYFIRALAMHPLSHKLAAEQTGE